MNVLIESLAYQGSGFGRLSDGMAVFVPFSVPGDLLEIEVVRRHKKYLNAVIKRVIDAGAGRCSARCRHFGLCGGCNYQHLDYGIQFEQKKQQFKENIQRIGGFCVDGIIFECFDCSQDFGYRNRISLSCFWEHARVSVGYRSFDSSSVLIPEECPLLDPRGVELLSMVSSGLLEVPDIASRWYLRVPSIGDSISFFDTDKNKGSVCELLLGREVYVPADGFWQVNIEVAEKLILKARDWLTGGGLLIDIYGGAGFFTLGLGDKFDRRVLVEFNGGLVRAARENCGRWGLGDTKFVSAPAEVYFSRRIGSSFLENTTVVIDPPRSGCHSDVINFLRASGVEQIFYVSCDCSTLARDLRFICADNLYELERMAIFDMFPQTYHFESAVVLRRRT